MMGARRVLGWLMRRKAFPAAEGKALRDELVAQHEHTTNELDQLRAVVSALQEQLDRWGAGCTEAIDALSERLAAVERTMQDHAPRG